MQTARQKAREKTMAIYAVDFDNTLAVTRFPEIVGPKEKVVAAVKMLKANGLALFGFALIKKAFDGFLD